MPLFVLGINHNTAPVEVRERVVFDPADIPDVVAALRSSAGVDEAMVLSTCNRTEIIGYGDNGAAGSARRWLVESQSLDTATQSSLFELIGTQATRHLCRVAAGLDSVVLGEPQIAGQLKDAYRHARDLSSAGPVLDRACRFAFSTAKQIRTETAIGENPVSVAYAAVSLASNLLDRFDRLTALLVGAGETVELVARHLHRQKIGRLFVANRTVETAEQLANEFGGVGLGLHAIDSVLPDADIVVASTRSPDPIISTAAMASALGRRRRRQPVFVADIAVPRDIEAGVADLADIYLYTVDDLQGVITESLAARQKAAVDAEKLIDGALEKYEASARAVEAAPLIRAVRQRAEVLRDDILLAARRRAETKGPDEALTYLANTLTNKLLHAPSDAIRRAAEADDDDLLRAVEALFDVDRNDKQ
ncbi:MAG: glutamyl-tRNA reductase [Pseudomonadota bacterium]